MKRIVICEGNGGARGEWLGRRQQQVQVEARRGGFRLGVKPDYETAEAGARKPRLALTSLDTRRVRLPAGRPLPQIGQDRGWQAKSIFIRSGMERKAAIWSESLIV